MSELAVTLLRLSYLLLLWLFVLAAIGVLRRDIYGTRITSRRTERGPRQGRAPAIGPIPAEPAPVKPAARPASRARTTPAQLAILSGPLAGTTVPLSGAEVLIGRAPECNLVIDDDYASNQHARLFPDAAGWWVEDLGSTNGTFLGPDRLTEPLQVKVGDELRIGRTTLQVRG